MQFNKCKRQCDFVYLCDASQQQAYSCYKSLELSESEQKHLEASMKQNKELFKELAER